MLDGSLLPYVDLCGFFSQGVLIIRIGVHKDRLAPDQDPFCFCWVVRKN